MINVLSSDLDLAKRSQRQAAFDSIYGRSHQTIGARISGYANSKGKQCTYLEIISQQKSCLGVVQCSKQFLKSKFLLKYKINTISLQMLSSLHVLVLF